ncbi:hypothetical protein [Yoonia sp.]
MTNTIALWLAFVIAAFLAFDHFLYEWANIVFLLRKLFDLIEWLAFWR